jgi:predicted phage replisome organizer
LSDVKWIKITTGLFDDEKIKVIESMPDRDTILIIWLKLLTLAGKVNDGGYIYLSCNVTYTDETLSTVLNRPINTVRLALDTFKRFNMIEFNDKGLLVINWGKHQNADVLDKMREDTRLRVQRFREKHQLLLGNGDSNVTVTLRNATDKNRIDKKEDKNRDIKDIFQIPEWIDLKTWDAFLEMRKKNHAIPTERAKELLIKELLKLKTEGDDPNAVLNQSIMNNYKGLFPLKNGGNGSGFNQGYNQQNKSKGIPGNRPAGAFEGL